MVVGLPQSMANHSAVAAAADLAEYLHIELLATFLADKSLAALAAIPAVRELRILDQGWQAIDFAQISRDIDRAASLARRRIAEAVGSREVRTRFDIVTEAATLISLIRADDIVAIIEPSHPGERITTQFTGLLAAALHTAAAVLVLPRRIVRTSGPIVAAATGGDDPALRTALQFAAALSEELIVLTPQDISLSAEFLAEAGRLGVPVEQVGPSVAMTESLAGGTFATHVKERLRVVSGGHVPHDASRLFSMLHGVPLLVVEPDRSNIAAEPAPGRGAGW